MMHPHRRWTMLSDVTNVGGSHTTISSAYDSLALLSEFNTPMEAITEAKSMAVYQKTRGEHNDFSEMLYYVAEVEKAYVELWMKETDGSSV